MPMPIKAKRVVHGVQGTAMKNLIQNDSIETDPPGEAPFGLKTATIDAVGLIADLFRKTADAQVDLFVARQLHDERAGDEALMRIRAAALLLASVPAPNWGAIAHKVLVATILRSEDDDATSHARRMVELAIRIDTDALQDPRVG